MKKGQEFNYKGRTYKILSIYAQQVATQHETEIDGGHFTIWDRKHLEHLLSDGQAKLRKYGWTWETIIRP